MRAIIFSTELRLFPHCHPRAEYQFREAELMRSRGTLCWLLSWCPFPSALSFVRLRVLRGSKLLTLAGAKATALRPHEQALSDTNKNDCGLRALFRDGLTSKRAAF